MEPIARGLADAPNADQGLRGQEFLDYDGLQ
jgi:hypothetical protein